MKCLLAIVTFFSLVSVHAAGKIVAVVSGVKGKAFYTYEGKTKMLRTGMHLPVQAEVFTDLGAQLSLNDYYDHIYHLSGGGHMVVHTNLLELKEGYLWVKSLNFDPLKGPLRVTTSNAIVEHTKGEGIVSFDVYTGKTQVLAVQGDFELRNIRQERYQLSLAEGQFSFISDEHENGRPRKPTPIGYSSFQKVTGLFDGVEPFSKNEEGSRNMASSQVKTSPNRGSSVKTVDAFEAALARKKGSRGIASVTMMEEDSSPSGQGKITVLKLHEPESGQEKEKRLMNYYSDKLDHLKPKAPVKKKWKPTYQKKSDVAVRIFGSNKPRSRVPASVKPTPNAKKKRSARTPASIGGMTPQINKKADSAFESELLRQYKKQMRHEQEVNQLIDQLQSIDMDYKKDY